MVIMVGFGPADSGSTPDRTITSFFYCLIYGYEIIKGENRTLDWSNVTMTFNFISFIVRHRNDLK